MADTPIASEIDSYPRGRGTAVHIRNRLRPIVGPQFNVGILQSDEDGSLFAARWETCSDSSCEFTKLAPVLAEQVISEEFDGGQAGVMVD
jgi:hypothetical protein